MPETTKTTGFNLEEELGAITKEVLSFFGSRHLTVDPRAEALIGRLYGLKFAIEQAKKAPHLLMKAGALDRESVEDLLAPGQFLVMPPPELDTVLEMHRQAGRACGAQVLADGSVVCWFGDIQEALTAPKWRAWGVHEKPAIFHQSRGGLAVEEATKWLRNSANG